VAVVRRVTESWLSDDPGPAREDIHEGVVVSRGHDDRTEGREAVLEAWQATQSDAPATAWVEREMTADVIGPSAVVRYRYELERDAAGGARTERGRDLWVLARAGDRWLAAYRMTLADEG